MHSLRITYEKYLNGDAISNEELDNAVVFFEKLRHDLGLLGPRFHLPFIEANRVYSELNGFKRAREGK